jgi:hypothetical protein
MKKSDLFNKILRNDFMMGYTEAMFFVGQPMTINGKENQDALGETKYGLLDFTVEGLKTIISECEEFLKEAEDTINQIIENQIEYEDRVYKLKIQDMRQAGIDFFFTRGGHGVGFWDGDWLTYEEIKINADTGERVEDDNADDVEIETKIASHETLADKLSDIAKKFGDVHLDVGNGNVYYDSDYNVAKKLKPTKDNESYVPVM